MSSKRFCKTYPRRLQDVLEDEKLLRWRRVEDQQMLDGIFFLVWVMDFSIISPSLGKAKVLFDNSNLTNLVHVQLLPENG